ncbi:uncharacterized protein LOC144314033 isoform X4 [Canis aureus]
MQNPGSLGNQAKPRSRCLSLFPYLGLCLPAELDILSVQARECSVTCPPRLAGELCSISSLIKEPELKKVKELLISTLRLLNVKLVSCK